MDWRTRYAEKLTTGEDAAKEIRSGQTLWIGMLQSTPYTFAKALLTRHAELRGVDVYHYISVFPWSWVNSESIRHTTLFSTPLDRAAVNEGEAEYLPVANFCPEHIEAHHPRFDLAVVLLSPPDDHGYMSFGPGLWINRTMCSMAERVWAEVDDEMIRTCGENQIHVSEVERLWPQNEGDGFSLPLPPVPEEVVPIAESICQRVANELIDDGDCVQIGSGDVSAQLAYHLGGKNDLGVQTEVVSPGTLTMMERGVITGSRKTVGKNVVVGCALVGLEPEELAIAHMNPGVELWDFCRTDDLRLLVQNDCFKAINNALQVDLTGQVTAEAIGPRVYSGPGGQTVFSVAASHSRGGASIIVTPSASRVADELRSRIVPRLPEGSLVTVPRTFIDYVVTEQGIAELAGRTVRERMGALIEIAHPDLRDELRDGARQAYGL